MTARKKRGITSGVSGILGLVIGVVLFAFEATPSWIPVVIQSVSTVAGILGFSLVYPDFDD